MYRHTIAAAALAAVVTLTACEAPAPESEQVTAEPSRQVTAETMTEDEKAIYAFGTIVAEQVSVQADQLEFDEREIEVFTAGFTDALQGREVEIAASDYELRFQELAGTRLGAAATRAQAAADEFVAGAAAREGAEIIDAGVVYIRLEAGDGERPSAQDVVRVHYHGTLADGTVFDSSIERGEPAEFGLGQVISCWTEGVQRMQVGETAQLVCPPETAYGEQGAGGVIPPNAALQFEVELLEILAETGGD